MEKLYCEKAGGRYEAFTYSDGQRVYVVRGSIADVFAYARKYDYQVVRVF